MKTTLFAAILILIAIGGLQADPVVAASPDKAHVMVFSNMTNKILNWNGQSRVLTALITFSNVDYVSSIESRYDQDTTFSLPGVKYDPVRKVFYVNNGSGRRIPVATMDETLFGKQIRLASGAKIVALDNHGAISVMLVADFAPVAGSHWVRVEETPALQQMFANTRGNVRARTRGDF